MVNLRNRQLACSLGRPPRCPRESRRWGAVHRRHDHVQRKHLRADPRHGAFPLDGTGHASRGALSYRGLVGIGF